MSERDPIGVNVSAADHIGAFIFGLILIGLAIFS